MKRFLIFLFAIAAVQARSAGVQSSNSLVAASDKSPGLVHLRFAVATGGILTTCAGSLIHGAWVLTAAQCLTNARFVWIRYNAVNVINPELVTESNTFRVHPNFNANTGANDIGLVSVNRFVESTDTIAPVALSRDAEAPESTILCIWGEDDDDDDVPGEQLQCNEVDVYELEEEGIVAHGNILATRFDLGTPLVSDGVQIAYMVAPTAGNYISGKYIRPDVDWINQITGLDL